MCFTLSTCFFQNSNNLHWLFVKVVYFFKLFNCQGSCCISLFLSCNIGILLYSPNICQHFFKNFLPFLTFFSKSWQHDAQCLPLSRKNDAKSGFYHLKIARKIKPKTKLTVAKNMLRKIKSPKVRCFFLSSKLKVCPPFFRLTQ